MLFYKIVAVSLRSYGHVTAPHVTQINMFEPYFRFSRPITGFQFVIAVITILKGTDWGR